ncbi:hypothetical protein Salat_2999500 [Sesamum alatum]|uniref:Uncharacterized protein n=1 Tax=Sesamum alatum TaxID=300844 RepID=A0AAE1XID6_9LAMI|nr:hypothetical protein Salat_2999500 [Sesamum alatum]
MESRCSVAEVYSLRPYLPVLEPLLLMSPLVQVLSPVLESAPSYDMQKGTRLLGSIEQHLHPLAAAFLNEVYPNRISTSQIRLGLSSCRRTLCTLENGNLPTDLQRWESTCLLLRPHLKLTRNFIV